MSLDGWNVHTPLSNNTWEPLETAAPVMDDQSLLATVTVPVVFRGSASRLRSTFRFGAAAPTGYTAYGIEPGMYCLGPGNGFRLMPYTDAKPHWLGEVSWAGIASGSGAIMAGDSFAFVGSTSYAMRETTFPQRVTNDDQSQPWIPGVYPYVPNTPHPTTGRMWNGIRLDQVPSVEVRFVMVSSVPPHPQHPAFASVYAWLKTAVNLTAMADYSKLLTRTFVTWAGGGAGPGQNAPSSEPGSPANTGNWFMHALNPGRRIAPIGSVAGVRSIHTGTALFSYQPLRQLR